MAKYNPITDTYDDSPDETYDFSKLANLLISPDAKEVRDTLGTDFVTEPNEKLYNKFDVYKNHPIAYGRLYSAQDKAANLVADNYYHTRNLPRLAQKMGIEAGKNIGYGEGHDWRINNVDAYDPKALAYTFPETKSIELYPKGQNPHALMHEIGHLFDFEKDPNYRADEIESSPEVKYDDLYKTAKDVNKHHHKDDTDFVIDNSLNKLRKLYNWLPTKKVAPPVVVPEPITPPKPRGML